MFKLAFISCAVAISVSKYDSDGTYTSQQKSFDVDDDAQAARDAARAQARQDKNDRLEARKQQRADQRAEGKKRRDDYKEELANLTSREEKRALMTKYRDDQRALYQQ